MNRQEQSPLMSVQEAAAFLRVTERCIYRWLKSGRIPFVKLGRLVRVPASELAKLQAEGFAR